MLNNTFADLPDGGHADSKILWSSTVASAVAHLNIIVDAAKSRSVCGELLHGDQSCVISVKPDKLFTGQLSSGAHRVVMPLRDAVGILDQAHELLQCRISELNRANATNRSIVTQDVKFKANNINI
jgi:hypothetical protein